MKIRENQLARDIVANLGWRWLYSRNLLNIIRIKTMKLYLWENVLCNYTCGVIFSIAESLEDARRVAREAHKNTYFTSSIESDKLEPTKILDLDKEFGFCLWGGG